MPGPFGRYSLYTADFGGVVLTDLFDIGLRSEPRKSIIIPGGDLHPQAVVTCCAEPRIRMSTKAFDNVLVPFPIGALQGGHVVNVDPPDSTTPTLLQFQKRFSGGAFELSGASFHTVGTSNHGFLYITDITAQQDDERGATINLEYVPFSSNGILDPITFSDAAVIANAPAVDGIWYMGPVKIGQIGSSLVELPGVQSVSIRSGIDFRSPRADGAVFSLNGSIHAIIPEIRITTLDFDGMSQILNQIWGDAVIANAGFNLFFQKGAHGGARVATATAEHVAAVAATGEQCTEELSVRELEDGRGEIVVRPTAGMNIYPLQDIP